MSFPWAYCDCGWPSFLAHQIFDPTLRERACLIEDIMKSQKPDNVQSDRRSFCSIKRTARQMLESVPILGSVTSEVSLLRNCDPELQHDDRRQLSWHLRFSIDVIEFKTLILWQFSTAAGHGVDSDVRVTIVRSATAHCKLRLKDDKDKITCTILKVMFCASREVECAITFCTRKETVAELFYSDHRRARKLRC